VNVWRALRDIRDEHRAWQRVADKPMAPEELPRPIEMEPAKAAMEVVVANGNGLDVNACL